jgi:LL-diaminopimelate aminotransferase
MTFTASDRIASMQPYFFADLGERVAALTDTGVDVIRMDIGSPDLPPADFIIDALIERIHQPGVHSYTAFGGTPAYRRAVAEYYGRRFGVELDPKTQVVGLIGSKEGIFTLNQVLLNPGDVALVPDPGYGTYSISARLAGADIYTMPLLAENGFLPDLDDIPRHVAGRAKLMWLNYPNNPTGAVADLDFFARAIDFARKYDLLIAHDTPYVDVCYGDYIAPSLLQIPGAEDWAVEFNSASKAYNMAGWRLGTAVGNAQVLDYIERYKSQKDTAHFEPVLYAGIKALTGDQSWVKERNLVYEERVETIMAGLAEMGLEPVRPKAALYTWTRLPGGLDDVDFANKLLAEAGVSVTPGSVFGASGTGYFRMSICIPNERIVQAMDRMVKWMVKEGYVKETA